MMMKEARFVVTYRRLVALGCGCCSDWEHEEESFKDESSAREEFEHAKENHHGAELHRVLKDGSWELVEGE